jgi:TP901 family phage tail tape measure protein
MQGDDITITIKANAAQFAAAIAGVVSSTKAMGSTISKEAKAAAEATSRLEDSFDGLRNGISLAMKATGLAVVAGLGLSAKSAGDFQSSLSQLKQAAGATADEMTAMTRTAKQLGKDNDLAGVTAAGAASAMTELAKAGLSVKDTMAASKGVMSLAKAGNMEFAEAAVIAASALNAFGLEGKDATKVADALAAGANASQADLADLALGLQQSATVAKQFKLSVNENVTALALFANNGIKGSDAGTSLKTMLIALANPSKEAAGLMKQLGFNAYDANGQFVGLDEMSKRLSKSTSKLTDQQKQAALATIFGTDAFRAAAVLADNAGDSYTSMSKSVGEVGAAQKAAAAQQGAYEKAVENFSNVMSDVALTIGEKLLPPLTEFISTMSEQVEPTFNFLAKNGTVIAGGLIAIGGAFATIRVAGMVSDFSKATKSLDLFVGAKNANGLRAIGDSFVAIGKGAKTGATTIADTTKSIATSATDIGKKGVTASASWIRGAYLASVEWIKSTAKIVASSVTASARAVAHGIAVGVAWVASAVSTAAAWVATGVKFVATQVWMGIEANSPALAAGLRWVASAVATAAAWVTSAAQTVAQFVVMKIQAGISAVQTAAAWIAASVQSQTSWVQAKLSMIGTFISIVASAVSNSLATQAALVSASVQSKIAWASAKVSIGTSFVAMKAAALKQSVASGIAWAAAAAKVGLAWLATNLKMIPFFIGWAIGAAANAVIATAAWVAGAVATAAAWVIANAAMLGVWGLIIAAIVGAVALIVANWSSISAFFVNIFNAIVNAVGVAINWVKANWPLLLAILTGPIGIAIYWIINNWELVKAAFAAAWEYIKGVWSGVTGFFGGVWSGIVNVFSSVGSFFSNTFTNAWNGIKNIFASVGVFFSGVWNTIVSIFGSVGTSIGNAISGAVKGVVNSILNFAENTINGFIRAINTAIGAINHIPGVNIGKLGLLSIPRLETGGYVPSRAGGHVIVAGEGGEGEYVVPESKLERMVAKILSMGAGGNSSSQTKESPSIVIGSGGSFVTVNIDGSGGEFTDNDAIKIAKKIARALIAQGLTLDEMGALR